MTKLRTEHRVWRLGIVFGVIVHCLTSARLRRATLVGTRPRLLVSGPLGMLIRKSDAEQRDDAEQALAAAARGELTPRIHARFPLERAADAHRELEGRRSVGAIVLTGP